MMATTVSATIVGIDAYPIHVEVDVSIGTQAFHIVGLPDGTIKESRDRIMTAINNSGYQFPIRKVVVNLAPAHLKKIGSGFDLPIAVAILGALGAFPVDRIRDYMIVGELALDGTLRPIRGALPMALTTKAEHLKGLVLPKANEAEAAVVSDIQRLPATNLSEVVHYFEHGVAGSLEAQDYDIDTLFQAQAAYDVDFQEVKGQAYAKRAMEVAAAGNHNIAMTGEPGSGKTMLARRMPSILPEPSFEEALEITKIHSIAGTLPEGKALMARRPFRFPHHTISSAGLVGGGSIPKPGEISLSHNGVLFLDELPEFPRSVLELLRQPLEDKNLVLARAAMSVEFPCNFMLLAAMNPCPCGYWGAPKDVQNAAKMECRCTPPMIQKYRAKVSGPLMDRIDIQVSVPAVDYDELARKPLGESSADIRKRVLQARSFQEKRFKDSSTRNNAGMKPQEIEQFAKAEPAAQKLLEKALNKMGLSARGYNRILKVARTIADLAVSETIEVPHISEAIQYRSLDRPVEMGYY